MSQPVLFAIDNDPGVVRALRDDLTRRFGGDFRVIAESSARRRAGGAARAGRPA
jgi:predicted SpoU family rRNA methylase